ncbi:MAG: hypothetical protein K6G40_06375 [Eubacterium sp.]|nr:hypothetical protein [Eubacterium sp.]
MSQEKVDRYKEQKANRKKNMTKAKLKYRFSIGITTLCAVAIVGYIGYSAYDTINANKTVEKTEVNVDSLTDYLNSVEAYV